MTDFLDKRTLQTLQSLQQLSEKVALYTDAMSAATASAHTVQQIAGPIIQLTDHHSATTLALVNETYRLVQPAMEKLAPIFSTDFSFLSDFPLVSLTRSHQLLLAGYESMDAYLNSLQALVVEAPDESELLEQPTTQLLLPETRERIVLYSPSLRLLEQLRAQQLSIHELNWRQFEEVVAELLIQDGYTVELGRGTKDGGKDITAVKELPGVGLVLSVWQAKKYSVGRPIGESVIRELADTRNTNGANKGVIVTTTSLTRGALERIRQDRYLLHKVDGNDLQTWIRTGQPPKDIERGSDGNR